MAIAPAHGHITECGYAANGGHITKGGGHVIDFRLMLH